MNPVVKEITVDTKDIMIEVKTDKGIKEVELDDYLFGVLAGEMPLYFDIEALKAQAVASRTFVMSRNKKVDNTVATQVYLDEQEVIEKLGSKYKEYSEKIKRAINETYNEVMKYDGDYISALFFASSNGMTNNCEDYFEGGYPYLLSVDSSWDQDVCLDNVREYSFDSNDIRDKLNMDIVSISIDLYDNNYVKNVYINDQVYTGREIRELFNLQSSSFDVVYNDNILCFTTYGKGHGVGMSQYGAQAMALEGYDYKDILNHYYYNVDIVCIE